MSLKFGYLVGSAIFAAIFIGLVSGQVKAKRFRPILYWATIVATTTLGTTVADFADRSVGLGYPGGVAIVATLLAVSLATWYWSEGTVSISRSKASPGLKSSGSIGSRSCSRRPWALRWATGWRAQIAAVSGSDMSSVQSSSEGVWLSWPLCTCWAVFRTRCYSGSRSF